MLKLGKHSRKLTRLQMYQRQYYRPKWAKLCETRWKEYLEGPEDDGEKKARITFINELCLGFLKNEPDEVQSEIDQLMERQRKGEAFLLDEDGGGGGGGGDSGGGEGENGGDEDAVETRKAAEATLTAWDKSVMLFYDEYDDLTHLLCRNITDLPKWAVQLLKDIHQKTGFAATILLGGPRPGDDGKIVSMW